MSRHWTRLKKGKLFGTLSRFLSFRGLAWSQFDPIFSHFRTACGTTYVTPSSAALLTIRVIVRGFWAYGACQWPKMATKMVSKRVFTHPKWSGAKPKFWHTVNLFLVLKWLNYNCCWDAQCAKMAQIGPKTGLKHIFGHPQTVRGGFWKTVVDPFRCQAETGGLSLGLGLRLGHSEGLSTKGRGLDVEKGPP